MRQTSLEAYQSLRDSGVLSNLRWAVYDALFHHGPMTRNELDARLKGQSTINASYSRRLTELESIGLAHRPETKLCPHTNRRCDAWDVTSLHRPVAPPPAPPTKGTVIASLKQLLREACAELESTGDLFAVAKAKSIRERLR